MDPPPFVAHQVGLEEYLRCSVGLSAHGDHSTVGQLVGLLCVFKVIIYGGCAVYNASTSFFDCSHSFKFS